MARVDFPLCVYCDNDSVWAITGENYEIIYKCANCSNIIVIESNND